LFAQFLRPAALAAAVLAVLAGLCVIACVVTRRDAVARFAVGLQAVAVLGGWFGAQAPALIPGRYTFTTAAAGEATIVAYLIAAACGSALVVPSLLLLFRIFKARAIRL
jgi:cytochrome d ubiquinol oxidase subunit II